MTAKCRIPREYISRAFNRLNRIDGDIDTLTSRIAAVRTWTYVSYRSDWIDDSVGWQQQTNELENKLSDALHDCLTQRFVDRDTAVLVRRLRDREPLLAGLAADGKVTVEGNEVGWLEGFNFVPNDGSIVANSHLLGAVNRVIREAIGTRVSKIVASQDNNFSLDIKTGTFTAAGVTASAFFQSPRHWTIKFLTNGRPNEYLHKIKTSVSCLVPSLKIAVFPSKRSR